MKLRLVILFSLLLNMALAQPSAKVLSGKSFSEKFLVTPVNINSSFSDFSPFFIANKLYFISTRNENSAVTYTANNQNTSDIFYCSKIDSVTFSKPKKCAEINSVYDDGPAMLNAKATYMVFSASNSNGKLQIYFSVFENEKWSKPLLHPVSRAGNSYCHPFLTDNGNTLFYCSDKEGGFGGMDIYYSRLDKLNWSNSINLGAKVNSSSNEIFPSISKNKQLYFSSKRASGMGELDIYSFDLSDSSKAIAVLLDSPVNSVWDDFGICFDSTQNNGYFSSNRTRKEGDNLFYFANLVPTFEFCTPMKKSSCYTFLKDTYSLREESIENEYEWDFGDGNKARAKAVKHCFSKSGFYTVKLNIVEKKTGKVVYNELAYTIAVRPQGLQVGVKDTLFLNTPIQFDAADSQLDGYTILNYTWLFNDTSFTKGSTATHQYSQNGIYLVVLGVEAQNIVTKQIEKFCIDKWILVGDKEYVAKNLKYFKYAELSPDADSLYFQNEDDAALNLKTRTKLFRYSELSADAFGLTRNEDQDIILSEEERKLRTHKFGLLGADESSLDAMNEEEAALNEKAKKLRTHKFGELSADATSLEKISEEEALLRAKQRLLRMRNASLPPIVDTLYFPKTKDETIFRVNLGWSDSKVDKSSGVFEGIQKLEESQEGKGYRYTSGKEKAFSDIVPYYENAQKKGFKDAAVVGFVNETISKGQAKNLRAILYDSALVENHALKVYYKYDVEQFDKKYTVTLDSLVKRILTRDNQKVLLITHFDGLGGAEYNMNLNTQRTHIMINYLVKKGIKKSQVKTEFIIHPTEKLEPDLLRRIELFLVN